MKIFSFPVDFKPQKQTPVSFDVVFKLCEVLEISPKALFDFRD